MLAGAVNFGDGKNFGSGTRQKAQHYMAFSSSGWEAEMQEYRAYIMGPDGHVQKRVDLRCNDEDEAIELAKQLVDGHDVELWQLDRQIRTLKADGMGLGR